MGPKYSGRSRKRKPPKNRFMKAKEDQSCAVDSESCASSKKLKTNKFGDAEYLRRYKLFSDCKFVKIERFDCTCYEMSTVRWKISRHY